MQGMISRYRDRLLKSSSQIKQLSASRQKLPPTDQLGKSAIKVEQKQIKSIDRAPLLPPKHIEHSKQKQKQKKTNQTSSKPSKKTTLLNTNSKSQQKLSRKTPKKIVTLPILNQNYAESIVDLITVRQQQNILLINKNDLKQKVKIFLDEYFHRRVEITPFEELLSIHEKNRQQGVALMTNNKSYSASHLPPNQQILYTQTQAKQNYILSTNQLNTVNHLQASMANSQVIPFSKNQANVFNKSLESQIEKRYIECEKQRQYFKNKVESLTKKCQNLNKQLQKYSKIEKLTANTIQSQNECRKEVIRLRKQLEVSELKNSQQQKIFRKQMSIIRQIIEQLKQSKQFKE